MLSRASVSHHILVYCCSLLIDELCCMKRLRESVREPVVSPCVITSLLIPVATDALLRNYILKCVCLKLSNRPTAVIELMLDINHEWTGLYLSCSWCLQTSLRFSQRIINYFSASQVANKLV